VIARRLLLILLAPAGLAAQGRDVEVRVGRWAEGGGASTYELRTSEPLLGPLWHGFAAAVSINDALGRRRAFYGAGYELTAFRPYRGLSPYGILGATIGLSTDTTEHTLGIQWSAGMGLEWRPASWLAFDAEARYRIEDRGPRGFWNLGSDARKALSAAVGLSIHLGHGGGLEHGSPAPAEDPARNLPPEVPTDVKGNAADVVRTALDAIGTPYQWGGTAENGFDCSGLIQYAYGRHGIRLPRTSHEQARAGLEVKKNLDELRPGDILLFSGAPGGGITHVGMYVGEHKFIHSSSSGVRLSFLDPEDPEGGYWIPRWVGARRILE